MVAHKGLRIDGGNSVVVYAQSAQIAQLVEDGSEVEEN